MDGSELTLSTEKSREEGDVVAMGYLYWAPRKLDVFLSYLMKDEWDMKSHRTLTLIEAWKREKLLSAKQA